MIRNRITLVVAGAAMSGLALAGCSSTSGFPPADAPGAVSAAPAVFIVEAADATTAAGSARISSTTSIGGMGEQGTGIRADGVVNFTDNEAALRVSSSLFGGGSDMQVTLVDGKSYVQVPMFGEKWIEMPAQDLGVNLADPAQSLDSLKKAANLTEVGPEAIDGVQATKYTGTIDLKDALGQAGLPADSKQALDKQLDKVSGTADVTVWVDNDGRIVRFDQKASIEVGTGKAVETNSSTTISDFGVATEIAPPAADQIVSGDSLKQQLGGLTGSDG